MEAADEEDDIPDDFDGIMDFLKVDEDEAISGYKKAIAKVDDEFVRDQLNKIATEEEAHKDYLEKVVDDHTVEYTEPLDDEDDIETESFVEELFSALSDKRDERAFPEGKLDLKAPHKDVPVVKCKITPAVTHSEDEKPLKEGDFFGGNEDDSEVNYMQVRGYETKEDFDNGYAGMVEAGEEDFFNSCKEDVDNGTYYAIVLGNFSCSYDEEEVEYDDKFAPIEVYPAGLDVSHLIED